MFNKKKLILLNIRFNKKWGAVTMCKIQYLLRDKTMDLY